MNCNGCPVTPEIVGDLIKRRKERGVTASGKLVGDEGKPQAAISVNDKDIFACDCMDGHFIMELGFEQIKLPGK
jgi:hypothetical protein